MRTGEKERNGGVNRRGVFFKWEKLKIGRICFRDEICIRGVFGDG